MRKYVLIGAAMLVGAATTVVAQQTVRFSNAVWTCWNFEDHHRITVGNHPDIILFVDTPATETSDRRVCVMAEER